MAVEYQYGLKEADDLASLIRSKRALYAKVESQDPMAKQLFYLKKEIDILVAALRRLALTANAHDTMAANNIANKMLAAKRMAASRYMAGIVFLYMFDNLDQIIDRYPKFWTEFAPVALASNLPSERISMDLKFIYTGEDGLARILDTLPIEIE